MMNLIRRKPIKYKFKKIAPCITHYLGVLLKALGLIEGNRKLRDALARQSKTFFMLVLPSCRIRFI